MIARRITTARKKPTKVVNIFDNCKFIANKVAEILLLHICPTISDYSATSALRLRVMRRA